MQSPDVLPSLSKSCNPSTPGEGPAFKKQTRAASRANRPVICDCGNPITRYRNHGYDYACDRCLALDGKTAKDYDILRFIVDLGGASLTEIATHLGAPVESTLKTLRRLLAVGRLTTMLVDPISDRKLYIISNPHPGVSP